MTGERSSLLLHEQLLLLSLEVQRHRRRCGDHLDFGLAGAVLLDLLRSGAATLDGSRVGAAAVSGMQLPEGPLADAAAAIAVESRPRSPRWWVDRLPGRMKPFVPRLAVGLVGAGVLEAREQRLLGLFGRTRVSAVDNAPGEDVARQLCGVLVGERTPSRDDADLAGLVGAVGLAGVVAGRERRRAAERRATELGSANAVIVAVAGAVRAAIARRDAATAGATAAAVVSAGA
jgi:hypothetical protein